jgi:cephalosporin-C deacetylase
VHRDRVERPFRTLSYFDGVTLARRATAPALISTALHDQVCPPSTVFAAANHYGGDVRVEVFPFNQHEGGQGFQWDVQARWARDLLATEIS